MEYMQFTAIVLFTLLTLKLMLLPHRTVVDLTVNRSRWLMGGTTAILAIQFLIQFTLGLRSMGITQAVLVNLLLFIPATWMMTLSILYLQRQGRLSVANRWIGGITWLAATAVLGTAALVDGQPLFSDTPELHWAEVAVSGLYLCMQSYYGWAILSNLRDIRHKLQDYYDQDMAGILRWMQFSVIVLTFMALMVPMLIFSQSLWLAVFAIIVFVGIFYMVDSFSNYVVSSAPKKVEIAERSADEEQKEEQKMQSEASAISDEQLRKVTAAVEQWVANGGYRRSGVNCPAAADEMHVPRYQLTAWLRHQGLKYTYWLADLRVEEAKRVFATHPDWSNETVALHCGFSDRSYFQTTFKKRTGITPAEYIESSRPTA